MSTTRPRIGIRRLPHAEGLDLPAYQSAGAAGADIRAALAEPLVLEPQARALVPTGLVMDIPDGWEVQVRPRSGLAARHGVTVLNSPGTVDSDYRGEVMAILVNLGAEPFTITRGERIAQIVVAPVVQAEFETVETVSASSRGAGGFGSTGR
jgi:dUTP pyrophosphatase